MDLSAKMLAQQDSAMPPRMPATMESKASATGGDGPENAPQTEVSQQNSGGVSCDATSAGTQGWELTEKRSASGWETADRKS